MVDVRIIEHPPSLCFVVFRIEGCQMEDREQDKMWLVRHLEVTRQLVIENLRVVKVGSSSGDKSIIGKSN